MKSIIRSDKKPQNKTRVASDIEAFLTKGGRVQKVAIKLDKPKHPALTNINCSNRH